MAKEVIITDPDYAGDVSRLSVITEETQRYAHEHKLLRLPNIVKVFFRYEPDHEIERISEELESVIDDLSNTRDKYIMSELNKYPVVSVKAHTRPFERRWLNIVAAIIVPVGIFLYLRMWMFRARLRHDLHTIQQCNEAIIKRIEDLQVRGKL